MTRVNELLRREIGSALFRVINEGSCDISAVTVTHVITSSDLRKASVLVSIRGTDEDRLKTLSLIRKHRADIQDMIHKHVVLKYTPRLSFSLDTSLEKGDEVLNILRHLDETEEHAEP